MQFVVGRQNSLHWLNNNKACYSTRAPYTFQSGSLPEYPESI